MKILIAILFSLGFSSCMHRGMMGVGHGHHDGQVQMMRSSTILEREVTVDNVKAIGIFPGLESGIDATFDLKLMDAQTYSPISNGQVYFEVRYSDPVSHHELPHPDIQLVAERRLSGVYTIPYRAVQPGEYRLVFRIIAIGDRELDPEIIVETTRMLSTESQGHHRSMMDGADTTPALAIGAATMGAMMIVMLVAGGGRF